MKHFNHIIISHADNGIFVKIGCVQLVYQQGQLDVFHNDLSRYLLDPSEIEKEIRKRWDITPSEMQPREPEAEVEERIARARAAGAKTPR